MRNAVVCSDALEFLRGLPDGIAQACVTSPPYYQLRDYGAEGQIGLEATPEEYVSRLVGVFREVRRVLHPTGTLWLVVGDTYARDFRKGQHRPGGSGKQAYVYDRGGGRASCTLNLGAANGLKPKDLIGIPWALAFALRADGWWLRQCVIWHKPNALPNSQTDRPTTDYEFVFLLARAERYYYDHLAALEPHTSLHYDGRERPRVANPDGSKAVAMGKEWGGLRYPPGGRRLRAVWSIPTQPFSARDYGFTDFDHYAAFPEALAERCVLLSTPEPGVCGRCGAPWRRRIEREKGPARPPQPQGHLPPEGRRESGLRGNRTPDVGRYAGDVRTAGWGPSCRCGAGPVPALVLDPFCGSGTTLAVAKRLGRDWLGCDINPRYVELARRRVEREACQLRMAF